MKTLYLVTGGAGHLGTAVIKRILSDGGQVRALCLEGEKHLPEGAEIYYGDVLDVSSLERFFSDIEDREVIVIHCAGVVSISSKFDQRVIDVNVTGTKNVTDLCVAKNVKKLIYVSSVHAIREKPVGQVMTEPDVFDPEKVTGLYAKTKAEATRYVLAAVSRGLDAEVVFPSGIIGPYDYGRSHTNTIVSDYVNHRLVSAVKGGYDFVDVRDVADGIIACAERGKPGEGYILSGGYHSIKEILYDLHEITGQKEIKSFLPVKFVNLVAPLCELYYKIRKEPPLFTKYSIYTLSCNSAFSNEKAKKELGFSPRNIKDTLRDTFFWLSRIGKVKPLKC